MNKKVVRLYPGAGGNESLAGLYLREDLFAGQEDVQPLIYANFLTSLDGRIAWRDDEEVPYELPDPLKSTNDFRLFLELYAHADCIVTHGGYMRALAEKRLGNVLQIPAFDWAEYILQWRAAQGLPELPDVVILSSTLEFPWDESLNKAGRKTHILSGANPSEQAKERWLAQGHSVKQCGDEKYVEAEPLVEFLKEQNYRRVYLVAGPQLLQELLLHGHVHRFFMTISHQLLGGGDFQSLIPEYKLGASGQMHLQNLYMDTEDENKQWYADFLVGK